METLKAYKKKLEGLKTYVTAAAIILVGVAEWLGGDVPGVDVGSDPLGWVLAGLGVGFLRAGVAKK